MFKRTEISCHAIALALLAQASIVLGPESVLGQESAIDSARIELICTKAASTYQLGSADGRRRFQLVERSRLQWSKNTNEDVYGNVYFWTDAGVPVAVASIFQFVRPKDDLDAEFHSLSVDPIVAKLGPQAVWEPAVGGITFRPLPAAPDVAARKPRRATQMRAIARQFRAERENLSSDVAQLRFLSTPVIEYESQEKGVLCGAIFAFVDQTDPEVWLMIEARQDGDDEPAFQYAIARMNSFRLRVYHRDELVFRADELQSLTDPNSTYTIFQRLQDDPNFALTR